MEGALIRAIDAARVAQDWTTLAELSRALETRARESQSARQGEVVDLAEARKRRNGGQS